MEKISLNEWIEKSCILKGEYLVDKNNRISVKGSIMIDDPNIKELPYKFDKVTGTFACAAHNLEYLNGFPFYVGGNLIIDGCYSIRSLEGAPYEVKGNVRILNCKALRTLRGCPEKIEGNFEISNCSMIREIDCKPRSITGKIICDTCKVNESALNESRNSFLDWLESNTIIRGKYKMNDNDEIDIIGSIRIDDSRISKFPVKFGKISGDFDCSYNSSLRTLEYGPSYVGGNFNCSNCQRLESLEYAPYYVGKDFICTYCNSLRSLRGLPKQIEGKTIIENCRNLRDMNESRRYEYYEGGYSNENNGTQEDWLEENADVYGEIIVKDGKISIDGDIRITNKQLEELPDFIEFENINGNFEARNLTRLRSLKGFPKKVNGNFDCSGCTSLESLEGAPYKIAGTFNCSHCNSLRSFKGAPMTIKEDFVSLGNRYIKSKELSSKVSGEIIIE